MFDKRLLVALAIVASMSAKANGLTTDPNPDDILIYQPPLIPNCPEVFAYGCENLRSPSESCQRIIQRTTYEPNDEGNCVVTGFVQRGSPPADIPPSACPLHSAESYEDPGDFDGCPDLIQKSYQLFTPDTWCCADCHLSTYEVHIVREPGTPRIASYECVPVDADPSTAAFDPITTGNYCWPEACRSSDVTYEIPSDFSFEENPEEAPGPDLTDLPLPP